MRLYGCLSIRSHHSCSAFVEVADLQVCRAYLNQFLDGQWNMFSSLGVAFETLCEAAWRDTVAAIPESAYHVVIAEISPTVDLKTVANRAAERCFTTLGRFEHLFAPVLVAVEYDFRESLNIALPSFRQEFVDAIEEKVPPFIALPKVGACLDAMTR